MKKYVFILSAVLLFAAGCRKENPAINTGIQSYLYSADSADWSTPDSGITWETGFVVPEVNQSVMNSGAVQIYYVDSFANNWQVPFYDLAADVNFTSEISAYSNSNVANVIVFVESANGSRLNDPGNQEFRVVVLSSLNKSGFVAPKGWKLIQSKVIR